MCYWKAYSKKNLFKEKEKAKITYKVGKFQELKTVPKTGFNDQSKVSEISPLGTPSTLTVSGVGVHMQKHKDF